MWLANLLRRGPAVALVCDCWSSMRNKLKRRRDHVGELDRCLRPVSVCRATTILFTDRADIELHPRFEHRKDNIKRISIDETNRTDIILSLPVAPKAKVSTGPSNLNALRRFQKAVKHTILRYDRRQVSSGTWHGPPPQLRFPSSETVNVASQWPHPYPGYIIITKILSKYKSIPKLESMRNTTSYSSQDSPNLVHALRFSPNGKHLIACLYARTLCA